MRTWLLLAVTLSGCATVPPPAALPTAEEQAAAPGPAKLLYTERIRDEIMLPALKAEVGAGFKNYDYEMPFVSYRGDLLVVTFSWDYEAGGCELDQPQFVRMLFDPKTEKVMQVETGSDTY